jgi:hypothetical protein
VASRILPVKDPNRPNCLYCGKPLTKYIHSWTKFDSKPEPVVGQEVQYFGKVVAILSDRSDSFGRKVRYWCGQYGRDRDGCFCGPLCASRWGVAVAQGIKKFENQVFEFRGFSFKVRHCKG